MSEAVLDNSVDWLVMGVAFACQGDQLVKQTCEMNLVKIVSRNGF